MKKNKLALAFFFVMFFNIGSFGQYLFPADTNMTFLGAVPTGYCEDVVPFSNQYLIAAAGKGIRIIDYSNASNPLMVSEINTKAKVNNIAINGNFLYLAARSDYNAFEGGLYIVDVSNILKPRVVFYKKFDNGLITIAHDGNIIFAGRLNTIFAFDATDPSNPKQLYSIGISNTPHGLYVSNHKLYVAAQSAGMLIYDISSGTSAKYLGKLNEWAEKCAVSDTLAFLTAQGDPLKIVSVKDPSNPYVLATVEKDSTQNIEYTMDVKIKANLLYATGGGNKGLFLKIIDIANPSSPEVKKIVKFSYQTNIKGVRINLLNNRCFIAFQSGFNIFDISSISNTHLISDYYTYTSGIVKPFGNFVLYGYSTNYDSLVGLSIYNANISNEIAEIGKLYFKKAGSSIDIDASGNIICFNNVIFDSDTINSVKIIDASSPSDPRLLNVVKSSIRLKQPIAVNNNIFCMVGQAVYPKGDSIRIFDISDPQNPVEHFGYGVNPHSEGYIVKKMVIKDNYLYAAMERGLLILKITSSLDLSFASYVDLTPGGYGAQKLKIKNGVAVIARQSGVELIDVSNPANPVDKGYYKLYGNVLDADYYDNKLYVAVNGTRGVAIFTINQDTTLTSVASYNTKQGGVNSLFVRNGIIYTDYFGLKLFKEGKQTSVEKNNLKYRYTYTLSQNYPNPFNPTTTIQFQLGKQEFVSLKIFDVLGKQIKTLVNGKKNKGKYSVRFNAANLPSGIYFYRLTVKDKNQKSSVTRKMILLK